MALMPAASNPGARMNIGAPQADLGRAPVEPPSSRCPRTSPAAADPNGSSSRLTCSPASMPPPCLGPCLPSARCTFPVLPEHLLCIPQAHLQKSFGVPSPAFPTNRTPGLGQVSPPPPLQGAQHDGGGRGETAHGASVSSWNDGRAQWASLKMHLSH